MKKVYEDEIQVVYEDESGARITSLKPHVEKPYFFQPERPNPETAKFIYKDPKNGEINPVRFLEFENSRCDGLNTMET